MPWRTTSVIRWRTVRATAGLTACAPPRGAPTVKVGEGRWPPSAIAAATIPICRGVASTSPCPIAVEPVASSPWMCEAAGSVLSRCAGQARVVVEAELFGHRHQPARAELDAERREHRVAGDCEGEFQRAAAVLTVGVVEADAVESRVAGIGEGRAGRGRCAPERPRQGDDLEGRARRLQAFEAEPCDGQHLAAGGLDRDDPAELAAESRDGRLLDRRRDRRADRPRRPGNGRGQHRVTSQQLPAGPARAGDRPAPARGR